MDPVTQGNRIRRSSRPKISFSFGNPLIFANLHEFSQDDLREFVEISGILHEKLKYRHPHLLMQLPGLLMRLFLISSLLESDALAPF